MLVTVVGCAGQVARMARVEISDAQWAVIGPFFPARASTGRSSLPARLVVEATAFSVSDRLWLAGPSERLGNWNSVYQVFRRWAGRAPGTGAGPRPDQHAPGCTKHGATPAVSPTQGDFPNHESPADPDPGDHAIGWPRGGVTSTIHLFTDPKCRPLAVRANRRQRRRHQLHDHPIGRYRGPVSRRGRPRRRPDAVLTDKANPSRTGAGLQPAASGAV